MLMLQKYESTGYIMLTKIVFFFYFFFFFLPETTCNDFDCKCFSLAGANELRYFWFSI